MDPPDFAAGGKSSPTSRELQGPRPAPLKLRKDSHKIKKSPQQEPPQAEAQPRRPVWIYSKSPRMIQATTDNFMEFVQRLTGASSTAAGAPGGNAWPAEKFPSFEMNPFQRLPDSSAAGSAAHVGDVSPARRLASIERTSPSEREKEWERNMNMVEELDMGFIPGILSPAPSSLAPVPTGFFSTECDLDTLSCSESRFIRGTIEERKQDELWFRMQINLADSRLSELPENPDCPFLEKLFLQQNSDLAAIPFSFFKNMPALQVLDLSDTSIKFLPPSVSSLVTLRELFVRDCQLLMELPPEIGALCNLRVLDLEGTKLIYLPKEIRMLLKLVCLKVSLYRCSDKYRESRGIEAIIPRATLSKFYYLKELSIDVDLHCGWWDIEVEAIIEDLCSLINLQTLKLYLPKVELLQRLLQVTRGMAVEGNLLTLFLPLTFSTLSNFRLIVGPHEQRIVSCLPVDLQVEFEKLEKCLKCVNGEGSTDGIRQVLKCTSALFLERHWSIEKLSVFKIDELDKLKFCLLVECNEMNAVVEGADFYDQQGDKRTNRADGKPALRLLQYLGIHYMKNLECVWRGSAVSGCLSSLIILDLHTCPNLFTIFSPLLLCNLTNLKELTLEDCPKVKSVICVDSCSYECLLPVWRKYHYWTCLNW